MTHKRWIPSLAWAAVILFFTSIPVPGTMASAAPAGLDKIVHFGLYAVLGFLLMRAMWRPEAPWRTAASVFTVIAVFAALDELHQIMIPGRYASVADWLADVAGGGAGAMVAMLRATRREWQS